MSEKKLIALANEAKKKAYAPYSNFCVGAAVLMEDGTIFTGSNVENASYGATICAERTAIVKAISEGKRRIQKVIVVSDRDSYIYPCGGCRQVIGEFSDAETEMICTKPCGEYVKIKFSEMMPYFFSMEKKV